MVQLRLRLINPAHSRVGRGNIVLRHRSPLSAEFGGVRCVLSSGTQSRAFASIAERRNENIIVSKYLILQSQSVPLRHDWPQRS